MLLKNCLLIFQDNACKKLDVQDEFKKNDDSSDSLIYNKLQSKMSEALYEKKLVIIHLIDYN